MSGSLIPNGKQQYLDANGNPLAGGKVYYYIPSTTTFKNTYQDAALTTLNTNPVVLDSAGECIAYGTGSYRQQVYDVNNNLIWDVQTNAPITLDQVEAVYSSPNGSTLVGYNEGDSNATNTTVAAKLQQTVSVKDFGAVGDGTTNDSTAIQNAINTGKMVYFPKGTYKCNVNINNRTILYGDGSTASIITPYVNTLPAMLYTYAAMSNPSPLSYWNYHSVVRDLGFNGTNITSSGSIGFSFGTASPTTYTTSAEYANNVQFYNCNFNGNYIGVQFPHGNIGTAFYSCGFQNNYYGVYMLDNRQGYGGGIMHAGNKYFYNGEMHGNVCAVYCDNQTDGFGAIDFTDVIFEANNLVLWLRNTSYSIVAPTFRNCWNEGNGTPTGPSTVTIDQWTGNTQSTQTVSTSQPWIISNNVTVFESCFAAGILLNSDQSQVYLKNCRVETNSGNGGLPITSNYANSRIYLQGCYTSSPISNQNTIYDGINYCDIYDVTSTYYATARARFLPLSYNVRTGANKRSGLSLDFTTGQAYNGTTSGTGTVVSDGVKYTSCNEVTSTLAANQYLYFTGTTNSNASGYWATTCDVKVTASTSGSVSFYIFNSSTAQMITVSVPADGLWHTIGGVGYYPSTYSSTLYFGNASGTSTVRISAYQMIPFSTLGDAEEFIASKTYLG